MNDTEIPDRVKRRITLSGLFYPLDRNAQRRWARAFHAGFSKTEEKLKNQSDEHGYIQENPEKNVILWKEPSDNKSECMFVIINDATQFDQIERLLEHIKRFQPVFTYAILHQKKDGEGVYDIFRLSRFSYLEHCNRVYAGKKTHPPTPFSWEEKGA